MFQYNLKSLLLLMLGVCILSWLFFVLPGEIAVVILMGLLMVIPSAILAGILYFRGYPQAFCIGCIPPLVMIGVAVFFGGLGWGFGRGDSIEMKIMLLISQAVVVAGGAASAGVRWLAVWSQQPAIQTKTFPGLSRESAPPAGLHPRPLTPDS
jgi:hypothetical protein